METTEAIGHTSPHDVGHIAILRLARIPAAPLCFIALSLAAQPHFLPPSVQAYVRDHKARCAIGLETEATTDPAGGLDSQVDDNGDFDGEQ